nr:alpha/beta fold hydrolase [Saccharopolyspora sp. HNM0983]
MCVAAIALAATAWPGDDEPHAAPAPPREAMLDVLDGPDGSERVQIDVTLHAPAETPAPAVLLAHGFGGDKHDVAEQARSLVARGFTVLTYSARGFGDSTGRIALNSPEYEVADARQLLDWMARQPEVLRDADGDPRVGVTGDSYGGALSLLLAGSDPRVDAIAPVMTYNDLNRALLPNAAQPDTAEPGVFKQAWAGLLFAAGNHSRPSVPPNATERTAADAGPTTPPPQSCGNFTSRVCRAYAELARTGRAGPDTQRLLHDISPKRVTGDIDAPTLLVQGQRDTLFGLDQADANARQITAAGGLVKTIWWNGGHDGDPPDAELRGKIADFLAFHLDAGPVPDPGTGFEYTVAGQAHRDDDAPARQVAVPTYPGLHGTTAEPQRFPLLGPPTRVINPPGGVPAATSSLPGVQRDGRGTEDTATDLPGQVASFATAPLDEQVVVAGTPRTRISVAAVPGQPASRDAVLFAKLYDVSPEGQRTLLGDAVAPLRVPDLPPDGTPVQTDVLLPGVVHPVEAGHRIELAVSSTDQAHALPEEPAVHRIGAAPGAALTVPSVPGSGSGAVLPVVALAGLAGIGGFWLLVWLCSLVARRARGRADPELEEVPLDVTGLGTSPGRGTAAVQDLSLRVERGQVVGLLGPNGAGKTTALRMVLGLVRPKTGRIRVFGHRVRPGAPVLSRVGSLVEGPGFLPHLSGVDNLRQHWAVTGRPPAQAGLDEVLRIAGLDEEAGRKVRTYSRGMQQRLVLAQAMLGLPDLLVLDEPANGLDPPQLHRMREILHRYAESGRAVLVSSHLLSEVEQTCTHAVVLHRGRAAASGTVAELVSAEGAVSFQVDEAQLAVESLRSLEGVGDVRAEAGRVHADLGRHPVPVAVNTLVEAGIAVHRVEPRRRLEDAFLQLVGEDQA